MITSYVMIFALWTECVQYFCASYFTRLPAGLLASNGTKIAELERIWKEAVGQRETRKACQDNVCSGRNSS